MQLLLLPFLFLLQNSFAQSDTTF